MSRKTSFHPSLSVSSNGDVGGMMHGRGGRRQTAMQADQIKEIQVGIAVIEHFHPFTLWDA